MRKAIIIISAFMMLALTSCEQKQEKPAPDFVLEGDTVCLMVEDQTIHSYDPDSWQWSFREKAIKYRIFSDDMKNYYTLICSQKPTTVGQEVVADLKWGINGSQEELREGLTFIVQRMDAQTGAIWLWCKNPSIGLTIIE